MYLWAEIEVWMNLILFQIHKWRHQIRQVCVCVCLGGGGGGGGGVVVNVLTLSASRARARSQFSSFTEKHTAASASL